MKTYDRFIQDIHKDHLQEMEYQAPPKPVPKAPIERKAQQPETRKAPGVVKAQVKPAGADHGDHPTDPKEQNKDTGKNVRRALGGVADAIKKKRAGASMASKQIRPDKGTQRPALTTKAPPVRSIF